MITVVHIVAIIGVDDVDVVRVAPTDRPGIDESECIAAILKAPMVVVASVHVEAVLTTKSGCVVRVGNAAMVIAGSVLTSRSRMLLP